MNYRHAFHAGNFADVMKHALLVRVLLYLQRKDTPIRVIDTHAGLGLYDLAGDEAGRTGEWVGGIGRLNKTFDPAVENLLEPYRRLIAEVRARYGDKAYPGSPAIVRELLRRQDRGVFVELHPRDNAVLAERFNAVSNLKVMHLDGWTALHALIPPKEKRGLVLIDPPYEEPDELERLGGEILAAIRKWPTGVYLGWYPIKDTKPVELLYRRLRAECPRPGLRLELLVDDPREPNRLNGSGLLVVNPPWALKPEAEILLPALAERLSRSGYGAFRCEAFGPEP
ncbi:23S rRNA (adenine(2030)-N(6))-methyltransferase RlmJ [Microvirga pudoricolor]|uniref:23S rRNA (adenine(2030)-N(6))-methyltransferase RlmJ n=1 Tax=Microvirga pudoricolor TaxID=2778729 RepID=UPI001951B04F|nr:23S rRNA (adenine(2030)-N(6))-methyltransferase RlmJ [Microvirga pudoricolor]MBM6592768.1 23S rRNA (adenine(2030)-N(6))-methyltransferase RlmJ [Microvirga pudoricolor]